MSIEGVELHADRNREECSNHMARRRSWEGSVRTQRRLENSANSDRNLRKRCCSTLPGKQSQMASKPHPGVAIVRLSNYGSFVASANGNLVAKRQPLVLFQLTNFTFFFVLKFVAMVAVPRDIK